MCIKIFETNKPTSFTKYIDSIFIKECSYKFQQKVDLVNKEHSIFNSNSIKTMPKLDIEENNNYDNYNHNNISWFKLYNTYFHLYQFNKTNVSPTP